MAKLLKFSDVSGLLCSPMEHKKFSILKDELVTVDNSETYKFCNGSPLLYPHKFLQYISTSGFDLAKIRANLSDPLVQYLYMNVIKWQADNNNLDKNNYWYKQYLENLKQLLQNASGTMLDIGTDDPQCSANMFSDKVYYCGLEPIINNDSKLFRVIGFAEFLPFADNSFENAFFGTSLDHVLDYVEGLQEARRVLVPGGKLYLVALVWTHNAQLYTDNVHFHHFREDVFKQALNSVGFNIINDFKISWKNDPHRKLMYLEAS